MRALVTGGAGFIGSHVVDHLIRTGHEVMVVDSLVDWVHAGEWPTWLNSKAGRVLGDILNYDLMFRTLGEFKPQVIIHLAAEVGVGQAEVEPGRFTQANVTGTAILLKAMSDHNLSLGEDHPDRIARLLVASSMSCYGEGMYVCEQHGPVRPGLRSSEQMAEGQWASLCPVKLDSGKVCSKPVVPTFIPEWSSLRPAGIYAMTKRDTEEMALHWGKVRGVPVAALRLFNTYGTRQSLKNPYTGVVAIFAAALLAEQPPLIFEDGWQARDFTHVSDVASAVGRLVGSQYLRQARKQWRRPEFQGSFNIGTGESTTILDVAEMLAEEIGTNVEPLIAGRYRAGDIRCCYADRGRMLALGWEPKVGLVDGLPDVLSWAQLQELADPEAYGRSLDLLDEKGLLSKEAPVLEPVEA